MLNREKSGRIKKIEWRKGKKTMGGAERYFLTLLFLYYVQVFSSFYPLQELNITLALPSLCNSTCMHHQLHWTHILLLTVLLILFYLCYWDVLLFLICGKVISIYRNFLFSELNIVCCYYFFCIFDFRTDYWCTGKRNVHH